MRPLTGGVQRQRPVRRSMGASVCEGGSAHSCSRTEGRGGRAGRERESSSRGRRHHGAGRPAPCPGTAPTRPTGRACGTPDPCVAVLARRPFASKHRPQPPTTTSGRPQRSATRVPGPHRRPRWRHGRRGPPARRGSRRRRRIRRRVAVHRQADLPAEVGVATAHAPHAEPGRAGLPPGRAGRPAGSSSRPSAGSRTHSYYGECYRGAPLAIGRRPGALERERNEGGCAGWKVGEVSFGAGADALRFPGPASPAPWRSANRVRGLGHSARLSRTLVLRKERADVLDEHTDAGETVTRT